MTKIAVSCWSSKGVAKMLFSWEKILRHRVVATWIDTWTKCQSRSQIDPTCHWPRPKCKYVYASEKRQSVSLMTVSLVLACSWYTRAADTTANRYLTQRDDRMYCWDSIGISLAWEWFWHAEIADTTTRQLSADLSTGWNLTERLPQRTSEESQRLTRSQSMKWWKDSHNVVSIERDPETRVVVPSRDRTAGNSRLIPLATR